MTKKQINPDELGELQSADLLVAAATEYTSPVFTVNRGFAYFWEIDVFGDASVGDFSLRAEIMRSNETDILYPKTIGTGFSSAGGGIGLKVRHALVFGGGVDALVDSPTGVAASNVNILKVFRFVRFVLEVTTLGVGTAAACFAVSEIIEEEAPGKNN